MGHFFLGEHYAALSETEQALIHLGKAETLFASMGMDYWVNNAQKMVHQLESIQGG